MGESVGVGGFGGLCGCDKGSRHYLQYVNEFANGENPVRL